jgi:hypothetical protein
VGHTGTLNASGDIDLFLSEETFSSKPSRSKRKSQKRFLESRYLIVGENVNFFSTIPILIARKASAAASSSGIFSARGSV